MRSFQNLVKISTTCSKEVRELPNVRDYLELPRIFVTIFSQCKSKYEIPSGAIGETLS